MGDKKRWILDETSYITFFNQRTNSPLTFDDNQQAARSCRLRRGNTTFISDWLQLPHTGKLGESRSSYTWVYQDGLENEAIRVGTTRLHVAHQLTKNIYNKKSMSAGGKFRHYNTFVKPWGLYASGRLSLLSRQGKVCQLEKSNLGILRKILAKVLMEIRPRKWRVKIIHLFSVTLSSAFTYAYTCSIRVINYKSMLKA